MDADRFDRLARIFAARGPRRRVLAGAAALLGGLAGLAAPSPAAAGDREAGQPCVRDGQCISGICDGPSGRKTCRCADGLQTCPRTSTNCCVAPLVCADGRCVNHCRSRRKDRDETDVDCGGDRCPKCGPFKKCAFDSDCLSNHCNENLRCSECSTDAHCPGPPLGACVDHACKQCRADAECAPGNTCVGNFCTPHCRNGVKDGDETDKDCGGSCVRRTGARCRLGQGCARDADCTSGVCVSSRCRECRERADCTDPTFRFCADNACVECLTRFNCPEALPHCVGNRCVECEDEGDCDAPTPACVGNRCVECSEDAHCPAGQVCAGNACQAGTCGAGQDLCRGGGMGCNGNPNCACRQRVPPAQGAAAPFCGATGAGSRCFFCAVDEECAAVTGAGSACVLADTNCPCGGTGFRACVAPCSSPA